MPVDEETQAGPWADYQASTPPPAAGDGPWNDYPAAKPAVQAVAAAAPPPSPPIPSVPPPTPKPAPSNASWAEQHPFLSRFSDGPIDPNLPLQEKIKQAAERAIMDDPSVMAAKSVYQSGKTLLSGLGDVFLPSAAEERSNPNSFVNQQGTNGRSDQVQARPTPAPMTPQENTQAIHTVIGGGAKIISGGGSLMLMADAPGLVQVGAKALAGDKAAQMAAAKIAGYVAGGDVFSRATGYAADKLQLAPETKELIQAAAFFVPSLLGTAAGLAGFKGDLGVDAAGNPSAGARTPGGSVRVGARATPEAFEAGAQVNGHTFNVTFPRRGAPPPASGPGRLVYDTVAQSAQDAITQADALSKAAEDIVNKVPPPPKPGPPTPPGIDQGTLTPQVVSNVASVIRSAPSEMQPKLALEAHGRLSAWMQKAHTFIGPDGKLQIADSPAKANALAQQVLNDEVDRHTQAGEDAAAQQKEQLEAQQKGEQQRQDDAEKAATTPNENGLTPSELMVQRAKTIIESSPNPQQASASIMRSLRVTRDQAQQLIAQHQQQQAHASLGVGSTAEPTLEESKPTVDAQIAALGKGNINVVMLPAGSRYRPSPPPGMKTITVHGDAPGAGTYVFNPAAVGAATIRAAANAGTHGDLLGHLATKDSLQNTPSVVVRAVDPSGTTLQDSQVPAADKAMVHDQAAVLAERHPGAKLEVVSPEQVLAERQAAHETDSTSAPWLDYGSEDSPESAPESQDDRRIDSDKRLSVSEMTPEQMRKELLTSSKVDLPNRRAFDEAPHAGTVAMSDADGLKAFNDRFGYEAGDNLLRAKAEALKAAGVDAYHDKGDEFLYRGQDAAELKTKLEHARSLLRERPIEVKTKSGDTLRFKGADFSYGTGGDLATAEAGLKQHKAEREASGQRARGELRGFTEAGPEGSGVDQGAAGGEITGPASSPQAKEEEPPLAEGVTRLYHGSAEHGRYDGPAWFSTNKAYARDYRRGAELQYADIATDKLNKLRDHDPSDEGVVPRSTIELSSDVTGIRKPLLPSTQLAESRPASGLNADIGKPPGTGDRVTFKDRNGVEREGKIAFKAPRTARIKDAEGRIFKDVTVAGLKRPDRDIAAESLSNIQSMLDALGKRSMPGEVADHLLTGDTKALGLSPEEGRSASLNLVDAIAYMRNPKGLSDDRFNDEESLESKPARSADPNAESPGAIGESGSGERVEQDPQRELSGGSNSNQPAREGRSTGVTDEVAEASAKEIEGTKGGSALDQFKSLVDGFVHKGEGRTTGELQRGVMRQNRGQMDRRIAVAAKSLEDSRSEWSKRPKEDSFAFFNAVENVGGKSVADLPTKDRALAEHFKQQFDTMRHDLQDLKPNVLQDYIENYFPHIWDRQASASQTIKQIMSGSRPFAGKGSFLKQRTIPTIQDGLDMGLKPVSYNPVDLFLAKYQEQSKFLMAHQTLEDMKAAGTAQFVRIGAKIPEGWQQLDDRIGTVQSKTDDGGLVIRGHYYSPADAAKVFNNYLSVGLAGRSRIYDSLRWVNNQMNSMQLGISAFHATTTAVNAVTSDFAIGIKQLSEGEAASGFKNLAQSATLLPSMAMTFLNGQKLMREYLAPGSYSKFEKEAEALADAGGRIKQNPLEVKPLERIIQDVRNNEVMRGLSHVPSALIELAARPIMEHWVPKMKIGAFYDMSHSILARSAREQWPALRTRNEIQKAWDSVDNRFGQLVYDNLFWNKTAKDALMLSTRSVGWTAGTIRELGGAVIDTAQQAARAASGVRPEVTDKMSFGMGLLYVTALLGATTTFLWQGRGPRIVKDFFFPMRPDGTRLAIPGYMKDAYAYLHSPLHTLLNKQGPLFQAILQIAQNKDFYGTEIRHTGDSVAKQAEQVGKYLAGEMVPFSFRGTDKMLEGRGAGVGAGLLGKAKAALAHPGDLLLGQLGFNPAPAYIQHSDAMNMANEYEWGGREQKARTEHEFDRYQARHAVGQMYRTNNVDKDQIQKYKDVGLITPEEVRREMMMARVDPLVRTTRSLTRVDEILKVYGAATPEEKKLLRPVLAGLDKKINKEPDPEMRQQMRIDVREALKNADPSKPSPQLVSAR